jgi:hypothetical protein
MLWTYGQTGLNLVRAGGLLSGAARAGGAASV